MASDNDSEVYEDNLSQIATNVDVAEVDGKRQSDEELCHPGSDHCLVLAGVEVN